VAFQPLAFQPQPKRSWRARVSAVWSATIPYKVTAAASEIERLDQSAWQRACLDGSAWINRRNNASAFLSFVIGGAVGASLLLSSSVWVRIVEGGLAGIGAWLVSNVVIYGSQTALAVKRQRDEARKYARALEAHARDYAHWARRHEIADDFRWDTFLSRDAVLTEWERRTPEELETHWRTTVNHIAAMMEAEGASDPVLREIEGGLKGLDEKGDGYGEDHMRRIWNNMGVISQNLKSILRSSESAPLPPNPPT
jgi:hypothetical protein